MNNVSKRNAGLSGFRRELDRVFDDFWTAPALLGGDEWTSMWTPATDIAEEEDHYLLTLEVPGMKREDLKIELRDNTVLISGERKLEEEKKQKNGFYSERRFGRFERAFALPAHVDGAKIEAQYQDGMLKIYVPKSESARPRQIKIGDAGGGLLGKFFGKTEKHSDKPGLELQQGENVA